uniref:Uncharacterized protein n=1 Tax=Anguilla anguilla TaxID=7936 RepID=A0A0E9R8P3_ANGAN
MFIYCTCNFKNNNTFTVILI